MNQNSNYQIVARKYRPQTFGEVVGQDATVTTLKNSLKTKRIPHAYLFAGTRGTGKTTLARLMAKALNCTKRTDEVEPCNQCASCKEITAGHSLNVIEIDGASNRGIDDMRQLNETISFVPGSNTYKIYIIDEVHMLTREAFNALLKTLEEPPSNVKFIFATTEPHKVLPTIISRCQRFDLNRISQEIIEAKLKHIALDLGVEIQEEALTLIANLASGALRDAQSLFDQMISSCPSPITLEAVSNTLGRLSNSYFFALDKAVSESNLNFAFELTEKIFHEGKDFGYFLDTLLTHYRTLLSCKISPNGQATHEKEAYLSSSKLYSQEQCLFILDLLIETHQMLSKLPFKQVHLEMLLVKIIRSKNVVTLATLTEKLTELEKRVSSKKPATTPPTNEPPIKDISTPPPPPPENKEISSPPKTELKKSKYDTLIRFTAVELEGSVKQ